MIKICLFNLNQILRCLLVLILLGGFFIYLFFIMKAILFPYQLDYGEAQVVDQAIRISQGKNIYQTDLSIPPYTISNYPPVYMALMAPFQEVFGPNFWSGRLISITSTLISALLIGLIIFELSHNKIASIVAGCTFLLFPTVVYWSLLARIDMTALAFTLVGLWIFIKFPTNYCSLLASTIFLIIAVYTRQSYGFTAPGAITIYLLLKRQWRFLFFFIFCYSGLGITVFLIANYLTQGGFYFHIIRSNMSPWRNFSQISGYILVFFALALVLIYLLLSRKWLNQWLLLVLYVILGLLSTIIVGKVGSQVNYFNEFAVGMAFFLGILVTLANQDKRKQAMSWIILIPLSLWLIYFSNWLVAPILKDRLSPGFRDGFNELRQLIRNTEGDIVIDEYMGALVLENRPIYIQPFDMSQLSRLGLWDQNLFLQDIQKKQFPYIIITKTMPEIMNDRWTPEMLAAIDQNYNILMYFKNTLVYVPNP